MPFNFQHLTYTHIMCSKFRSGIIIIIIIITNVALKVKSQSTVFAYLRFVMLCDFTLSNSFFLKYVFVFLFVNEYATWCV